MDERRGGKEPDIYKLRDHIHGNEEEQIKGIYPRLNEHELKIKALEMAHEGEEALALQAAATLKGRRQVFDVFWNVLKYFLPATLGTSISYALWAWLVQ